MSNDTRRLLLLLALCLAASGCGGRSAPFSDLVADAGYGADGAGAADAPLADGSRHVDAPRVQSDGAPAPPADAGPPIGVIPCGSETCAAASQECCATRSGSSCVDRGSQCSGVTLTCAGPEDCQPGAVCCAVASGANRGVSCSGPQACQGQVVCRGDGDCPGGQRCCGGGDVRGVSVTWCDDPANCGDTSQGIVCGNQTCAPPGEVCCVTSGGSSCTGPNGCTQGARVACSGPQDCSGAAPVCCGTLSGGSGTTRGTSCVANGACAGSSTTGGVICQNDGDCPNGLTCTPVPVPGLSLGVCR